MFAILTFLAEANMNSKIFLVVTAYLVLSCQRGLPSSQAMAPLSKFSWPMPSKLRCFKEASLNEKAPQIDAYYRAQKNFPAIVAERSPDNEDQYRIRLDTRDTASSLGITNNPSGQVFAEILGQAEIPDSTANYRLRLNFKIPEINGFFSLSSLSWGVVSQSANNLSRDLRPGEKYSSRSGEPFFVINLTCWTYSKQVPAIDETLFLNGDHRYALKVSGLVPGKNMTGINPDQETNYLVISELSENTSQFLDRSYQDCQHTNKYVPVLNKDNDIVGWVTHLAKNQTGPLKGLIETVHGPKFKYSANRVITWDKDLNRPGRDPRSPVERTQDHESWNPDLTSENYKHQLAIGLAALCRPLFNNMKPDYFYQTSCVK
jgi:hypothetical protein